MKKILLLVLCLVAISMGAGTGVYSDPGVETGYRPIDTKWYTLWDSDITDGIDSIATDNWVLRGPYPLTNATNSPQFKGFGIIAEALAAGDSLYLYYQMTRGASIADTVVGQWILADSVGLTGAAKLYVDISDEVGEYIWFKGINPTASESIIREIKVYFKKDYTYNK